MKKIILIITLTFGIILMIPGVFAINRDIDDKSLRTLYLENQSNVDIIFEQYNMVSGITINGEVFTSTVNSYITTVTYLFDHTLLSTTYKNMYWNYDVNNDPFDSDYEFFYIQLGYDSPSFSDYNFKVYDNMGSIKPNEVITNPNSFAATTIPLDDSQFAVIFYFTTNELLTVPNQEIFLSMLRPITEQLYFTERNILEIMDDTFNPNQDNEIFNNGYEMGRAEFGWYDGSNWITAAVRGLQRYNEGLEQNRGYYGIFYNGEWLNATQYGAIRYNDGFDTGLDTEINWFEWAITFFLMPFRILNIQILPGILIGYFALFSLLIGVVGWFFFLVGKGGGRRK